MIEDLPQTNGAGQLAQLVRAQIHLAQIDQPTHFHRKAGQLIAIQKQHLQLCHLQQERA